MERVACKSCAEASCLVANLLAELEQPPYDPQQMEEDKAYIAKKLGLTVEEFQTIIDGENKTFRDYRNSWGLIQFGAVVLRALGVEKKKFR